MKGNEMGRPTSTRECDIEGCSNPHRAKGLCNMHWQRMRATGDTDDRFKGPRPRPLAERFWEKVDKSGECWIWTAVRNASGYGTINTRLRPMLASRVSFEMTSGPIPAGLVVRHKCDNPPCVNPAHLELGTHADNMRDMRERHRSARGEQHSQARLNNQSVSLIRERLAAGETRASIARAVGVSSSCIDNIANGKTWTEIAA